ncbi:demeter-like protein 3 [Rhynchospora pubera]|uniref:Demeter-like protein 3 n=1 Tax=Rhynchospora pubera TaxID=906938 RepID=A0AAV8F7D2_9POAL|nr:demeter-like protein 3 [Rhynchospora pubera]
MEITSRRNSFMQQLAGALASTEVPPPEMKKSDFVAGQDSGRTFTPVDVDLLSGSPVRTPSHPRSKLSPNSNRGDNIEQIPPVTPGKTEKQFAKSANEVEETNSMPRKKKRKKYKPKVVDDGASGQKTTKSVPGNSKSSITPNSKQKNAKAPTTPDPRPPVTPESKLTNHEASISSGLMLTTLEAPHPPDSSLQHIRAQITPDPNSGHSDREGPIAPDLELDVTVSLDAIPERTRPPNTLDSTPKMFEGPVTPAPKSELKHSNWPGSTRSVRKQLNFDHKDDTVSVRSEEITTGTNPNLNNSIDAISPSRDEVIKQLHPLQEALDSGSRAENKSFMQEESTSGTPGSSENSIGITSSLNCPSKVKPVQLVANELDLDLGDKTEAVMHGELHAATDSRLIQGEIGKVKNPTVDIDLISAKDYLIYLATLRSRGVKRRRVAPRRVERSPKSHFDDLLEEIVSKMKHMKLYENALIPYQGKKYRGIVELDEDSLIEWNLLMGGDGSGFNSAPGANTEREEKWREERDKFRDLAEGFIAKMKLIQGNRSFSEWKGSVVDSVVGAFLTQNVSDQLSSSAFISLCARFPRRQDGSATWAEMKLSGELDLNDEVLNNPSSERDIEHTKSCLVDKPTSAVDIVDTHIKDRSPKTPKGNTLQEFTIEGSHSLKANKANVQERKGYKIGSEHIDWDALRKEATRHRCARERKGVKTVDAADWDAVRRADMSEVAVAIQDRGQNNILAERIQDFLNRVAEDHGSIDLEWLRSTSGDEAKEYLLSVYGLGLKSVECVRLLTLHQVAFPVDTNVGRICVRLGWVPLQPLPDAVQMHLLELYPVMDSIQKYLWPRLCKLDQKTLYELHYQMITFGKVFCTKSKPNCNACPLRSECKHFASAFASARLMLPESQEKSSNKLVNWNQVPTSFENARKSFFNVTDVPTDKFAALPRSSNSEPIIEEPMTPEEEQIVEKIPDIEDLCFDDPDEIPTINLNMESFVRNIEEHVRKNDSKLQIEDISKALVLLSPIAASIPPPQLKHSRHLRTVHVAYELPDGHPILRMLKFEERDPDDKSPYLLILYSPEQEVSNGKTCQCTSCKETKSCSFLSEEEENSFVLCSFMIPCRTAMRGSFPLNGTYFQVNEVFADHCTARNPVKISREDIWNLTRRPVYFGSTVSTIMKGLPTEEVQYCFWRGFVCVREFDRVTRYPKPLSRWLHLLPTMKKK